MNFEASRLETFKNWPASAPVDPRRIAKAGFYYMGQNLEVQCFRCGGRLSEWNYNDKVMTRHRVLDPTCPFVLSPALSGNVPIINNEAEVNPNRPRIERWSSNELVNEDSGLIRTSGTDFTTSVHIYKASEHARLASFQNWPVSFIVTPASLAKAGFYCVNQGDKVKCAFCFIIIGRWEIGDDPLEEHRRHSQDCPFIQSQPCSSVSDVSNNSGIIFRCSDHVTESDSAMKSLGVQSHRVAKHPKYSCKEARLATYSTWPSNMNQTPNDLAEAGFYYAGSDDQVRCFHCDGGLRKWDPTDDPWVEHARWFPECGFVVLVKGDQFINEVILQHPPLLPEVCSSTEQNVIRSSITNNTRESIQVSEEDLERFMNTPTALAALQIGLDSSRVKMAIRQKMEQTGSPFKSPDDLIEATLDIQLDEAPFQDSEETWSTPMNSPVRQRSSNMRVRSDIGRLIQQLPSLDSLDSSECESDIPNEPVSKSVETSQRQEQSAAKLQEAVPSSQAAGRTVTLEEENRRLREARLCKICMDCEVCVVFLPCGHLVTCVACAHSLADCPVCRRAIKATVRTFLS